VAIYEASIFEEPKLKSFTGISHPTL